MWSVVKYVYNKQEYSRFDSDAGEDRAVTELGRPQAEHCNSQDVLERTRAEVDAVCRHINRTGELFMVQRRGERGGWGWGGAASGVCVCVRERARARARDKRTKRYRDT